MSKKRQTESMCTFTGCTNPHRAKGLCMAHHYQRLAGKPLTPLRPKKALYTGCKVEGCTRRHYARGYCHTDYNNALVTGNLSTRGSRYYLDISDDTVRAIRQEHATGEVTYKELGAKYEISWQTIGRIVRGETRTEVA